MLDTFLQNLGITACPRNPGTTVSCDSVTCVKTPPPIGMFQVGSFLRASVLLLDAQVTIAEVIRLDMFSVRDQRRATIGEVQPNARGENAGLMH